MGLLVYAVASILLVLLILRRGSRFLLFILQFVPFLFLFFFLWFTQSNYRVLHVKKIGYQFEKINDNFKQPSRTISIGGDRQKDDLYLPELPSRGIQLHPALGDNTINVEVRDGGVLILRNRTPLNGVLLNKNDRIQCGNSAITYDPKGGWKRSFTYNGNQWSIPGKKWKVGKEDDSTEGTWQESSRIEFSEIASSLGTSCSTSALISKNNFRFSASRQPIELNPVFLIAAGSEIKINDSPFPSRFPVRSGDLLTFYKLEKDSIRSAGSFLIQNSETLDVLYSSSQTLGIKEELLKNGSQLNKPLFLTTSTLPYSVFPTAHYAKESARFSGLFAYIQTKRNPLPQTLQEKIEMWLPQWQSQGRASAHGDFEVVTEEGTFRPSYGDRFTLGKKDRIVFSVQQIEFPWTLLLSVLVIFLLKIIFQPPFFNHGKSIGMTLVLITVDFFLVTRFLFSFRAATLYPFSSEALWLSCLALLMVPYLIYSGLTISSKQWDRSRSYNFAAYSLLMLVLCAVLLPDFLWLCAAVVLVFGLLALIRFHPRFHAGMISNLWSRCCSIPVDTFLLVFFALASLLQLLGAGEAIHVAGIRLPLSLVYHPVFLLFAAHYISQLKKLETREKNPERTKDLGLLLVRIGLLGICYLIVSLFTADLGFFLLYCVPVLFLAFGFAAYWVSEYELKTKALGLLLAAPAVLFLILFSGSSFIDKVIPLSSFSNPYIQRILLTVDPEALEESGLLAAEKQLGHQRTFLAYSHGGVLGAGYMNRPVTPALSITALNDNVPSAFLLNDFGIFGFLSVLLVLLAWVWLWLRSRKEQSLAFVELLSLSALITIVYVDLYMIFSNCGIFLFSGKNVFLWGLNSISDIFHSSIMLIFLLIPFIQES